jgi:V8-like Glu-specific endopeptidase
MKILLVLFLVFALAHAFEYSINTSTEKEQEEALKFWTPERLRNAIPMEEIIKNETLAKMLNAGQKFEPDTDFVTPESKYQEYPYQTTGRAFFQYGSGTASCSGSAVGKNVILTAAHCVYKDRRHFGNWIFIPQYNSGRSPVGRWTTRGSLIFQEYRDDSGARGRDVAFVFAVNRLNKTLEETVGKLEVGTCDVNDQVKTLGYSSPGAKMQRTNANILTRWIVPYWYRPSPVGIRSKQGPGSSGGPWILQKKQKNGKDVVCSVTSYGVNYTYFKFGPFFDAAVLEMHKIALQRN